MPTAASAPPTVTTTPTIDTTTVIKNPGMGWQLYAEEFSSPLADATTFWNQVDPYASAATTLYLRVPWSRMEPQQGVYAWNSDSNYKALVQGASSRGIKLAFRVVVDSQDVHQQATPQFVFDAGAQGYGAASNTANKTPYLTDPVFRTKFANFVTAFGAKYNDSAVVDYVDANGLGWWGEMSNIQGMSATQSTDTLNWVSSLYAGSFNKVMQAVNYPTASFSTPDLDAVIGKYHFAIRRDGLGSTQWLPQEEKDRIRSRFDSGTTVLGENCYQNMVTRTSNNCDSSYAQPSLTGMLERVVDDAKYVHANTLDLRWPQDDVPLWVRDNPALVRDFALNGGYRLALNSASWPTALTAGSTFSLTQTWSNSGVGRLPNDQGGWNGKYRVAYALLDNAGAVASRWIDPVGDPGNWVKGPSYTSTLQPHFDSVAPGSYRLAYGIVDTSTGNNPAIALANSDTIVNDWHVLGETSVSAPVVVSSFPELPTAQAGWISDQKLETAWSSVKSGINFPGTIDVDYGAPQTVRGIKLATTYGQGQGITNLDVQTWDGSAWTTRVAGAMPQWNTNSATPEIVSIPFSETVTTQKIRLVVRAANLQWGNFAINELNLDSAPVTAQVSSRTGNGSPAALIDGKIETPWATDNVGVAFPSTLDVHYPTPRPINKVAISTTYGQGQGPTIVDVQSWNGKAWVTSLSGATLTWPTNTANPETLTLTLPATIVSSDVRVVAKAANLQWGNYAVTEINPQ
ncbi:discoidin domain-containing protein [Arthrobacter sp. ISL-72]|uniref:discoidin domain-containing protein n=1 Tax=Arthrobacter sp. ISL-72 TaxID=2819114 RepID=UPI001BED2AF0|nr:discoidin domain-containing protein [Arthrobacter sp. ISL-72]MBT2594032.1 discoidin domain-containing protein [Arthrobacter sp. ISL-72]